MFLTQDLERGWINKMFKRLLKNKMAVMCIALILILVFVGIFAPIVAPNDPYENNILNKFAPYSWDYPLGTDHLGRCVFSRMIYGIRPTLFLSLVTMIGTIGIGTLMGLLSGYFKGIVDDIIMRIVDMMLSFPSQIMILAIVALLGVDIRNVIIANVFIKWAWYARMIRTNVIKYTDKNFILFSRCIGSGERFILFRHMIPCIASEMAVLATLDIGWAVLNISTLSFLGLGVQAPIPEWGAMLNEAKNVMTTNPIQMIAPGVAVVILVAAFNFLGDCLRDAFDPKEAEI
jgi:nickel transport system permease protein